MAAVVERRRGVRARRGAVAGAYPDLAEADDTFRTLRAWHFQAKLRRAARRSTRTRSSSRWPTTSAPGESLTGADVARAYTQRTALAERMRDFFESYDVLVLPVSQVPPFPADQEFPTAINGRPMETYLDWMRSAYFITVTGCPAISVPAAAPPTGCRSGSRSSRRTARDRCLLEVAAAFEAAVGRLSRRCWTTECPQAGGGAVRTGVAVEDRVVPVDNGQPLEPEECKKSR